MWLGLALLVAVAVVVKVGPDALVASWHGMVRLATEGPAEPPHPKVVVEPPRPAPPPDPLGFLSRDTRAAFTTPVPGPSQPFRFQVAVQPKMICMTMSANGIPNPGWRKAGGGYACESDLVPIPGSKLVTPDPADLPPGESPEPRKSTMFFAAHGEAEDQLQLIRFKLNLDDPSVDEPGRVRLLGLLEKIAARLSWSVPETVRDAILHHRKISETNRGVLVEVHPEDGPVQRLNVVLILETPARRLSADRFQPVTPEEAEALLR